MYALTKDIVLSRLTQAGVIPTDVIALVSELQQTLVESYGRAQQVAQVGNQDADKPATLGKLTGKISAEIKAVKGSEDLMIRRFPLN